MRRVTSASALVASSAAISRAPRVSSASSGRPIAHVTSQAASSKALPVPWPNETPARFSRSLWALTSWTRGIACRAAPRAMAPPWGAASEASVGAMSCHQALEGAAIDVLQHVEAGDVDALVDLVDAGIDRPELDHLGADALDVAPVRRPTRGRKLAGDAGVLADRCRHGLAECAGRRQEGLAAERPGDLVRIRVLDDDPLKPRLHRFWRRFGAEPEVEVDDDFAGNDIAGAGAGVDVRYLPRRGREVRVAAVPFDADELREQRRGDMDRISREVRIGDMPLHADDAELAGEGASPAVLDHVAEADHRGRLADDAVVERRPLRDEPVADTCRAIDRRAFLVAGDEKADAAAVIGRRPDELFGGDDHRRDRALHVGGAAAVELAITLGRHEGIAGPGRERAGRNDVGVAGEDEPLAVRALALPLSPETVSY